MGLLKETYSCGIRFTRSKSAKMGKTTNLKLWVIFGLFISLIVGLLAYEVSSHLKQIELRKKQQQNIENTKAKQLEILKEK